MATPSATIQTTTTATTNNVAVADCCTVEEHQPIKKMKSCCDNNDNNNGRNTCNSGNNSSSILQQEEEDDKECTAMAASAATFSDTAADFTTATTAATSTATRDGDAKEDGDGTLSSCLQPLLQQKPSTSSSISSSSLLLLQLHDLPEDVLRHVAMYLMAPDVLHLICVHPHIYTMCGNSSTFWNVLSNVYYDGDSNSNNCCDKDEVCHDNHISNTVPTATTTTFTISSSIEKAKRAKQAYLLHAYKTHLPQVQWIPIENNNEEEEEDGHEGEEDDSDEDSDEDEQDSMAHHHQRRRRRFHPSHYRQQQQQQRFHIPDSREGHLACTLGTKQYPIYVFNGGFTDDTSVYCLVRTNNNNKLQQTNPLHESTTTTTTTTSTATTTNTTDAHAAHAATSGDIQNAATLSSPTPAATWLRVSPTYSLPDNTNTNNHNINNMPEPSYVYGASLTRLDDRRAIRFGGFQSGGYTAECNQVAVLTIDYNFHNNNNNTASTTTTAKQQGNNDNDDHNNPPTITAHWQVIATQAFIRAQARAYHTATLLLDRYLLVVGGMTSRGCILSEAILDTHTWQWLNVGVAQPLEHLFGRTPSGRHGHSMVLDERRNRLLLFGGGSGTNLLRSGTDNTEVWELNMGDDVSWKTDLVASLPWGWKQLYANRSTSSSNEQQDENNQAQVNNDVDDAATTTSAVAPGSVEFIPTSPLSPGDGLCLGRCHVAFRVSANSVIFAFGSGRPSTNAVLAYDLRSDTFMKPNIAGPIPRPRFTAAAVFMEDEGYLLVHGGYCTQDGETTHEMAVLDLAPSLHRTFDWMQLRQGAAGAAAAVVEHELVGCEHARRAQQRATVHMSLGQMMLNLADMDPDQRRRLALEYMAGFVPEGVQNSNLLRIIIGARAAQLPARQYDRMMETQQGQTTEEEDDDDDDDYDDEDDEETEDEDDV